jgi:putative ABC transport system permease protein
LRVWHSLISDEPDDFRLVTNVEMRNMVTWIRRVLFSFVPMVAAVVLLVAGIGAATLILSSANERVAEIGLRRAIGAHGGTSAVENNPTRGASFVVTLPKTG